MRLLHLQLEEELLVDAAAQSYDEKEDFSAPNVSPGIYSQSSPTDVNVSDSPRQERERERQSSFEDINGSSAHNDRDRKARSNSSTEPDGEQRRSRGRDDMESKSDQPAVSAIAPSATAPPRSPDSTAARKKSEPSPAPSSASINVSRRTSGDKFVSNSALQKQQRLLEEGMATARGTPDYCAAFGVLAKGIFDGGRAIQHCSYSLQSFSLYNCSYLFPKQRNCARNLARTFCSRRQWCGLTRTGGPFTGTVLFFAFL